MNLKPSAASRFLRQAGAVFVVLTLAACGGPVEKGPEPPQEQAAPPPVQPPWPVPPASTPTADCFDATYSAAADANTASLRAMALNAFGRAETGWEIYAPRVAREIGSTCAPESSGFAKALAGWQSAKSPPADGIVTEPLLLAMKAAWQAERPVTAVRARGVCPAPPATSALDNGRAGEGYGGKTVQLRRGAFAAYRAMVAAARAETPEIAADPRNLTIFSAYRSPDYDAARCARDGNCNGIVRAVCSPHRTGLAMDIYVGEAPGYGPDSTADPNRLAQTKTPTYRWLLANAQRFGFVNYPFEPWHWEWTGEAP